jgi:hypothetical protein
MENTAEWKKKSYEELLAPLVLQFERSGNSYKRYLSNHHYLHAQTLKVANSEIMRLLLEKSFLIPENLKPEALKVIDHLDVWFVQFEQLEKDINPNANTVFIFERPQESIEFPKLAEKLFIAEREKLKSELGSK